MIMKLVAALCAILVCASFAECVSAQCSDYAGCAGQRADAQAKLGAWARETAEAVAEERRAIATERAYDRMMALTATELARPTRTPTPTPIPTTTRIPTATATPTLSATSAQIMVVQMTVQVTVQVTVQSAQEKPAGGISNVGLAIIGTLLFVLIFGAVVLFRPQTYILPFRGGKRDE